MRDLNYKLAFLAFMVQRVDRKGEVSPRDDESTEDVIKDLTDADRKVIIQMKEEPKLYQHLVNSIAPGIYGGACAPHLMPGHEEIKRGILLMLFGGVHKDTRDGIRHVLPSLADAQSPRRHQRVHCG